MIDFNRVSKRIFNTLKGHGYQLKVFTAVGAETVDPEEGRNFFVSEPNMLITLDESAGEIKLNKSAKIELNTYEEVLTQLKNLARHYMLRFSIKNYGKEIKPKDFSYQAKKNKKDKEMNTVTESKMYGSKKTSYQVIEGVKILVRHRSDVDESVRGSRSRNIQAIFLESNGERYRFPLNHLSGARAMARHLSKGGNMHDIVGEHIVSTSGNYLKLCEFMRYVSTNKLITENSNDVISVVKENLLTMIMELKHLSGSRSYDLASSRIEESASVALNEEELGKLKDMFTVRKFDEKFTEVLPIVNQLVQHQQSQLTQIQEAAQNVIYVTPSTYSLDEDGIEYVSEEAKFGNKLKGIASRIVENELLSKYLSKVGQRMIEEGKISKFEENIVRSVLENCKEFKEEAKVGAFTEVVESFTRSFDKYQYTFLLEGLQQSAIEEDVDERSLYPLAKDLGMRLKRIEQIANEQGLKEYEGDKPKLIELGHAIFQYEAARKGLGILNKLRKPEDRKKHASRVMSTLNKLRALVQRLEAKLGINNTEESLGEEKDPELANCECGCEGDYTDHQMRKGERGGF